MKGKWRIAIWQGFPARIPLSIKPDLPGADPSALFLSESVARLSRLALAMPGPGLRAQAAPWAHSCLPHPEPWRGREKHPDNRPSSQRPPPPPLWMGSSGLCAAAHPGPPTEVPVLVGALATLLSRRGLQVVCGRHLLPPSPAWLWGRGCPRARLPRRQTRLGSWRGRGAGQAGGHQEGGRKS